MQRWLSVLTVLCALTGLLAFGVIPTQAIGFTRILFGIYAVLLVGSLLLALSRRD